MLPDTSQGYLFLNIAYEILDIATQSYSRKGNAIQVHELKRRTHGMAQGEWSVATITDFVPCDRRLDHYQIF